MEREASLSKALACRATQEQELITEGQLEIIQSFLSIGNQNSSLREYVLKNTGQDEEMWDQMLIFLALVSFRPEKSKLPPPLRIDEVWHKFILCTREYMDFCHNAAGRYLHHVPDSLSSGDVRIEWFEDVDALTRFLNDEVSEYDEESWSDPDDFEIMNRQQYERYKEYYYGHECSDNPRGTYRSGCDSCGERCAD